MNAIDQAREALEAAKDALNTWVTTYAFDMCSVEQVEEARAKIDAACGTLAYIADANKKVCDAIESLSTQLPLPSRELPPLPNEDDCIVHMLPSDLELMAKNECMAQAASVRWATPEQKSVPLYTADQMREYAALCAQPSREVVAYMWADEKTAHVRWPGAPIPDGAIPLCRCDAPARLPTISSEWINAVAKEMGLRYSTAKETIENILKCAPASEPNGGNMNKAHRVMITSGEYWRCQHGRTSLDGCTECEPNGGTGERSAAIPEEWRNFVVICSGYTGTVNGKLLAAKAQGLLDASPTAPQPQPEQPKLVLALPDYEKRRIVIASDEVIDGERVVCVVIQDRGTN